MGYFIALIFVALSIIVVDDFVVFTDSFQITKYYFFGLIGRSWRFTAEDNIKVSPFGSDFGQDGDIVDMDDTVVGIGYLYLFSQSACHSK